MIEKLGGKGKKMIDKNFVFLYQVANDILFGEKSLLMFRA